MKKYQSMFTLCQCLLFITLSVCAIEGFAEDSLYETIKLTESYILKHQNPDGGWPLVPGQESDVEVTSFAMQALMAKGWGTGTKVIRGGVSYLIKHQNADGSWNGNTAHTIFALIALTQAETDPGARFKGLKWIQEAQNEDGSWGREMHQGGNLLYTATVLDGFRRLDFKQDFRAASKAADWLANPIRINMDGGWSMLRGQSSDILVTTWILQGLSLVYDIDVQIAWLKQMQNEDGGFGRRKGEASDPEITAYAIMALVAGKDPLNTDRVAIGYLRKVQQEDGSFVSATPIELKQPTANLQTTCFVLLAMYARSIEEALEK
ncbi:terpene cyclase/mutase family protein [Candidatus Poribacteria bacterium]|nr:terpene cyclase/mutase family protein [Candidatus Poribacteria bacterium]